jgi:hypothetical protein
MFKNLKETHHEVEHEVTVTVGIDPNTKSLLKTIGVIVVIHGAARLINTVVDHKLNSK